MASGSSRGLKRELESGEPEEAQGDQDESESIVAFALYKPRPMITDMTKGGMGEIARRMCPTRPPKPVGQLDRCTTGLMIFTTNGRLTCHLNSHVSKTYRAWYDGWTSSNGRIGFRGKLELTFSSSIWELRIWMWTGTRIHVITGTSFEAEACLQVRAPVSLQMSSASSYGRPGWPGHARPQMPDDRCFSNCRASACRVAMGGPTSRRCRGGSVKSSPVSNCPQARRSANSDTVPTYASARANFTW